ncbi:hybrid sensor histidine kinase/response regulator [Bacillus sp. JJ722]|uniref:hybrid sensor histidine kinase/response regulator n=1 Tax=Bacillus sp. JJ722 TaxID=3122973 RepID=UPI002FFF0FFC
MNKKKLIFISGMFLIVLTCMHVAWNFYFANEKIEPFKDGVLDLREQKFSDNKTILLKGEWQFAPNHFFLPNKDKAEDIKWKKVDSTKVHSPNGFGSYRLRILLNPDNQQEYSLSIKSILTASKVFVNGKEVAQSGIPANNEDEHFGRNMPYTVPLGFNEKEIEIVIHASNFDLARSGGIYKPIEFGTTHTIKKKQLISQIMELAGCILFLFHGVYSFIFYLISFPKKQFLYLAIAFFCGSFVIVIEHDLLLMQLFPQMSYEWSLKILEVLYISSIVCLIHFFAILLPNNQRSRFHSRLSLLLIVYCFFIPFIPFHYPMYIVMLSLGLMNLLIILITGAKTIFFGQKHIIFILLCGISILSSVTWGIIDRMGVYDVPYYSLDFIIAVFCLATFTFKNYYRVHEESKELTKKLQKVDKMKDEFLANTSHEVRNPLHGIMNIAQIILERNQNSLDEESKNDMQLLINISKRLSLILNDLLDATRLKESEIRLHINQISIHSVVTGVFEMLQYLIEGKNIQFVIDIPKNFPHVAADENRLIQILFNLIHNSIKFTSKGKIMVRVEEKNRMANIHVKDTGIGMDAKILKRIFEPYEQGDPSIVTIREGFGLGLSICKQLVKLHGGNLSVQSIPGKGTTFTFTLPLAKDKSVVSRKDQATFIFTEKDTYINNSISKQSSEATGVQRILIVDDDPVNVKILREILLNENYDVVTCTNGCEAFKLLMKGTWDLVIADVMMPKLSGYELTQKIREHYSPSELHILLLTARRQLEDMNIGFRSGANDYVIKPVEKIELVARVRALTDLRNSVKKQVEMEAAWLQAQIKPHFLFNTLNTIMAYNEIDSNKMLELLEVFADYLRESFDTMNLEQTVPLEKELKLVHSYIFIEQVRFGERLQIKWDIDKTISFRLPPLSIQTIVENAVRHGVLKQSNGGTITISIKEVDGATRIMIADDGVGMDANKIESIFHPDLSLSKGIGLRNTDKRLKRLYGEGLHIISAPNLGTTISFSIPRE